MLDFVAETCHQMPLAIGPPIIGSMFFGSRMWWYHGFYSSSQQAVHKIRVMGKSFHHALPIPNCSPARKALVSRIPCSLFAWQQTPLCATATYPFHCFNKLAAFRLIAQINNWLLRQQIPKFRRCSSDYLMDVIRLFYAFMKIPMSKCQPILAADRELSA